MAQLPKIAIIGRPNVGKSALFNRIIGKRIAIVDEAEGITRDRLAAKGDCFGRPFELIDTGGIDPHSDAPFNEQIKAQAELAILEADSLILVVDSHIGMTALDEEVAKLLLKAGKPVCVAVNKIDTVEQEIYLHPFHGLGIPKLIGVSALHGFQIAELVEASLEAIPPLNEEAEESAIPKIAVIGRANVGKSTLINCFLEQERCIVSPIAGTTRDSIDLPFKIDEKDYTLIDTAGIRRKNSEKEVVDKFAAIRTERAMERADLCLLMLDVTEGFTHQDKKILNAIEKAGKGCILLFNKWDLVTKIRMEHCLKEIERTAPFAKHLPKLFLSAKTGRNVSKILIEVHKVFSEAEKRVSTGELNRFLAQAMQLVHPPMIQGKRLRVYYMTQTETLPPTFVLFVNYPDLLDTSYKRYLMNQFRKTYQFWGLPIYFRIKARKRREDPALPV